MYKINIKKTFPDDRITRVAGERLRNMIIEAANHGEDIEIDFCNIIIASTSFFDEGIAKLVDYGWTRVMLADKIKIKNIHPKDKLLMEKMCKNRGMK